MTDLAPLFLTGGFALVGTLGGVAITQHFSLREARLDRAEQHKAALREELSKLTYECQALIDASWLMIPILAKMTSTDLREWVDTDSAKESGRRRVQILTSLARLCYLAGDLDLVVALAKLERCINDFAEKAHGPALEAGSGRRDLMDAIAEGFKHLKETRQALQQVVTTAAPLLALDIRKAEMSSYRMWARARSNRKS